MTKTTKNETAVRDYLQYVHDPATLVDDDLITSLQEKLDSLPPDQVLEQVKIHGEIFAAQNPDPSELEEAFVQAAPIYAEEVGLSNPVGSFKAVGVQRRVLARAFPDEVAPRSTQRTTVDDVVAAIPEVGTFTINQIVEMTGASRGTVVKALEQVAEDLGADPNHTGKGQAPTLYRRAA